MARSSKRNTGAYILGGVIGGAAGAAVTLWKTPKSGEEMRAALAGGLSSSPPTTEPGTSIGASPPATSGRFSNPVLSFVERAAAPIVGVELGKLAKDDPEATESKPVRSGAADAKPPAGTTSPQTSRGDLPVPPEDADTYDEEEGSHAHAATVEELTSPPPEKTGPGEQGHGERRESAPFPDLESNDRT